MIIKIISQINQYCFSYLYKNVIGDKLHHSLDIMVDTVELLKYGLPQSSENPKRLRIS